MGVVALHPAAFAADPSTACKAAFDARSPFRIFMECGQLIADGEDPADANTWDYLTYASELSSGLVTDNPLTNKYLKRSIEAPGMNGRQQANRVNLGVKDEDRGDSWYATRKEVINYNAFAKLRLHVREATQLRDSGRHKEAAKAYGEAIATLPDPIIYAMRADAHGALGWQKERAADLRKAIELAEFYGAPAQELYRRWRLADEKAVEAHLAGFDLSAQYKRWKPYDNARASVFERCAYMAAFVNAAGHRTAGQAACREAIAQRPDDAWLHHYLGLLEGRSADQVQAFQRAIELNPKFAAAYIEMSDALVVSSDAKALEAVATGLALDPSQDLPLAGFQQVRLLSNLQRIDELNLAAERYLSRRPFDKYAWKKWVEGLMRAQRYAEALRASAGFAAAIPHADSYSLRAQVLGLLGQHNLASLNFMLALEDYPAHSTSQEGLLAAFESQQAAYCSPPPPDLVSMLGKLPTLLRPPTDASAKKNWTGMMTQWQADGALRIWIDKQPAIYLLPGGENYQKENKDGSRGPGGPPRSAAGGRKVYELQAMHLVYWPRTGAFYFGPPEVEVGANRAVHMLCSGRPIAGPYLNGIPKRMVRVESESAQGGKAVTQLTGDVTITREPNRQDVMELPGLGRFQGLLNPNFSFKSGVFAREDGTVDVYYDNTFLQRAWRGQEKKMVPPRGLGLLTLTPEGGLSLHDVDVFNNIFTIYPASGASPYVVVERKDKRTAAQIQSDFEAQKKKEAMEESLRQARSYTFQRTQNVCYRCQGSGKVWAAGGASQFGRAPAANLTPAQAEAFRNSSASVGVAYSSGSMTKCPVCNGEGHY